MFIEGTVLTLPLKTLEGLQQSSKGETLDFFLKLYVVAASHTHVVAYNLGLCMSHLSKQIFLKEPSFNLRICFDRGCMSE